MKAKAIKSMLACTMLAGLLTVGCGSLPFTGAQDELHRIQSISQAVVYVPAAMHLQKNPETINDYVLARNAFDGLLLNNSIDPGALSLMLQKINIEEEQADQISIIMTGAKILVMGADGDVMPIDSSPKAKAVALGIRDGLDLAIKHVTGEINLPNPEPVPDS